MKSVVSSTSFSIPFLDSRIPPNVVSHDTVAVQVTPPAECSQHKDRTHRGRQC